MLGSALAAPDDFPLALDEHNNFVRRGSLPSNAMGDAEVEVSRIKSMPAGTGPSSPEMSVVGLRDRLLREARSERQRCLEVAEAAERRRAQIRGCKNMATQTDPVVIQDAYGDILDCTQPVPVATRVEGRTALSTGPFWGQSDEDAQAEALRTIKLLGRRDSMSASADNRLASLELEVDAERAARQELEAQVAHERTRKEAAHQQVHCLEYELDGKEQALQMAEFMLEKRDAELLEVQTHVRNLVHGGGGHDLLAMSAPLPMHTLTTQGHSDRERQLESQLGVKDQHIQRLLNQIRQSGTGTPLG